MTRRTIAVIGASLSGLRAAQQLRAQGYDDDLVVVGAGPHLPYDRPPLSKEYLLGKAGEEAVPVAPEAWYAENDVDLRLGVQVAGIDPGPHTVRLSSGETLGYGALLLATGALPRHIPLP